VRGQAFAISVLLAASAPAAADPAAFLGVSYNFGGTLGVTLKVLSDDEEDNAALAGGVSYFPWEPGTRIGLDLGVAYLFQDAAVTAGWDFLGRKVQVGLGYVNTDDDDGPPVVRPVNGGGAPVNGGGAPVNGGGDPVNGGGEPINGGVEPVNGGGEPVNGDGDPPPL
jgi:hypothetical protein